MADHPNEAYKCKYCSKFFLNKKEFAQHKRDVHWDVMSNQSGYSEDARSDRGQPMPPPPPPATRRRPRPSNQQQQAVAPAAPTRSPRRSETSGAASPRRGPGKRGKKGSKKSPRRKRSPSPSPDSPPPSPSPSPPPRSPPAKKRGRPPANTNPRNLPANYGQKRTVRNSAGEIETEWIRNPKQDGG